MKIKPLEEKIPKNELEKGKGKKKKLNENVENKKSMKKMDTLRYYLGF